jgi:hypothetical protein
MCVRVIQLSEDAKEAQAYAAKLPLFLTSLKRALSEQVGPHACLLWYDAITTNGQLSWQSTLNEKNASFFESCDGIFTDYHWKAHQPPRAAVFAEQTCHRERESVWFGVDVHGRGSFGGAGFDARLAAQALRASGVSMAVFAPAWTYENARAESREALARARHEREERFWGVLAPYIDTRKVPLHAWVTHTDAFVCTFNCGYGLGVVYVDGVAAPRLVSDVDSKSSSSSSSSTECGWMNIGLQSPLIALAPCVSRFDMTQQQQTQQQQQQQREGGEDEGGVRLSLSRDCPFDGGHSLKVEVAPHSPSGVGACVFAFATPPQTQGKRGNAAQKGEATGEDSPHARAVRGVLVSVELRREDGDAVFPFCLQLRTHTQGVVKLHCSSDVIDTHAHSHVDKKKKKEEEEGDKERVLLMEALDLTQTHTHTHTDADGDDANPHWHTFAWHVPLTHADLRDTTSISIHTTLPTPEQGVVVYCGAVRIQIALEPDGGDSDTHTHTHARALAYHQNAGRNAHTQSVCGVSAIYDVGNGLFRATWTHTLQGRLAYDVYVLPPDTHTQSDVRMWVGRSHVTEFACHTTSLHGVMGATGSLVGWKVEIRVRTGFGSVQAQADKYAEDTQSIGEMRVTA